MAAHRKPAARASGGDDVLLLANRHIFGHAAFRPLQRNIVESVLADRDVFVLLPTGAHERRSRTRDRAPDEPSCVLGQVAANRSAISCRRCLRAA
jgi:hypothetical protein